MERKEEVVTLSAGEISPRAPVRASGVSMLFKNLSSNLNEDRRSILGDPPNKSTGAPKKLKIAKQRKACLQFVEVILFLVGFLVLMWIHEDIEQVFELEHVMKIEMTKPFGEHSLTFNDIEDVVGIWEWLEQGLLPVIVTHKDAVKYQVLRRTHNSVLIR